MSRVTAPTRIWLIRHALVAEYARAVLYGTRDVPLCDATLAAQGAAYASLARRLPQPAHWLVTPLARTRLTAEAIFRAGYPATAMVEEPDLIEQHLGDWQGLPHAELPARLRLPAHPFWPHAGEEQPPGGESFAQVTARVGAALERIAVAKAGQDVVAVSHGGAIRAAIGHALGLTPHATLALSVVNLSLTGLERHPGGWRVVCVNTPP